LDTPYVIAEAGVNHTGDIDRAVALVDAAADVGARYEHPRRQLDVDLVDRMLGLLMQPRRRTGGNDFCLQNFIVLNRSGLRFEGTIILSTWTSVPGFHSETLRVWPKKASESLPKDGAPAGMKMVGIIPVSRVKVAML